MTASAIGVRVFTLADFAGITTGLTGHARASAFYGLPEGIRAAGFAENDQQIRARSDPLWESHKWESHE